MVLSKNGNGRGSASEVADSELQKYELEELLGLEYKRPLQWWKEHESS